MRRDKISLIALMILIFFFPAFAEEESDTEKSRIQEVKEKIAEEAEKQETEKEENEEAKNKDKDTYNKNGRHGNNSGYDLFFRIFRDIYRGFYGQMTNVRYASYPYADNSSFNFCSAVNTNTTSDKIAFLNSSVETSYLGKDIRDTYGATVKVSVNLYSFHLNYFYQRIFSSAESMTYNSINAGISFATSNLNLTPFAGAFYIEFLEETRFSFGANLQVFLPYNYIIDLYSLNSSYGSLNFNNFSVSLNYAFYRFNFGLGFNYNNYAGVNFSGPLAKISFWL